MAPSNFYRLQLLAPALPAEFSNFHALCDPAALVDYLQSLQRLRAKVYLQDGAIQPWQIDAEGRHRSEIDGRCWHFLLVDEPEECVGCARYLLHPPDVKFDAMQLRAAVEAELARARNHNLSFAELGGWAIAPEYRHSKAALEILLGSYAWAAVVGHYLCATTATLRNQSAPILRRMGGRPFVWQTEEVPGYFDAQYGCAMEILRFDSREMPQRFSSLLREMRAKLQAAMVVCAQPTVAAQVPAASPLIAWSQYA